MAKEHKEKKSFTYTPHVDEPDEVVAFGIAFKKGVAVEVEDEAIIAKLSNNITFDPDRMKKEAKRAENEEVVQRAKQYTAELDDAMNDPEKDGADNNTKRRSTLFR